MLQGIVLLFGVFHRVGHILILVRVPLIGRTVGPGFFLGPGKVQHRIGFYSLGNKIGQIHTAQLQEMHLLHQVDIQLLF